MSRTERKLVYSVTLHERVAEELRRFDSAGKLSRGITRAQALLELPNVLEYALAVESGRTSQFYARLNLLKINVPPTSVNSPPPVLPGGVIPPSVVLPTDNPFDDDQAAPGGPGGLQTERSAESGDVAGAIVAMQLAGSLPSGTDPLGQERHEIAALEDEARGLDQGPTAPAQEPPPDDTLSKAYRELNRKPDPSADVEEPTF